MRRNKSLWAVVTKELKANPLLTTQELFDRVRIDFNDCNPNWLRNTLTHYKSQFRRRERTTNR